MNAAALTPSELFAIAGKLPRVPLAHLPTPLEELPRFSARVGNGVRIFIKRDDCTGLLLGGNKARHNEFLLGDAVAQGCDMVVWGAGFQSNNCRQTAAGCAKLGLECRLYLSRMSYSSEVQGNLLLDYLVGAHVEFTDAKIGPELDELLAAKAAEFRSAGRKPYYWHRPRVVPLAAISYAVWLARNYRMRTTPHLRHRGHAPVGRAADEPAEPCERSTRPTDVRRPRSDPRRAAVAAKR